ncbi:MAG: Holliday junction resolvase RuvX [Candidatus Sericytochromatia bacterium]|nr:Holliday junction resolvase RuvX [Candidatus Tanganyikabacteria bacterium]
MTEPRPRILGLDVGNRRIGVAVSDPFGWTAQGAGVIERRNMARDLAEVQRIAELYQSRTLVIGFPRTLAGTMGPQAESLVGFTDRLSDLGFEVIHEDERFTTKIAERVLIAADVPRSRRREVIDQQAAMVILQGFLDRRDRQERNRSHGFGEHPAP